MAITMVEHEEYVAMYVVVDRRRHDRAIGVHVICCCLPLLFYARRHLLHTISCTMTRRTHEIRVINIGIPRAMMNL
jgi:hypothetical protein